MLWFWRRSRQNHNITSLQGRLSAPKRRDPRVKVLLTLAFILYAVTLPDGCWLVYLISLFGLGVAAHVSRVRWFAALRRSGVALPFALAAVSTAFTWPGAPWLTFHIGPWALGVTRQGAVHFLSVLSRAWLAAQAAAILALDMPFARWMWALRRLGVPAQLVTTLNLMHRYLAVLTAEGRRLQQAREARLAAPLPGRRSPGLLWQLRTIGHMAGQLFLRSYSRAERVYQAMLARGYRGEWPLVDQLHLTKEDWALGILGIALLLVIQGIVRL